MTFEEAQQAAARVPDMMSFNQWQTFQQCRTNVMPAWWYSAGECQQRYVAYVAGGLRMLELQNPGVAAQKELGKLLMGKR